MKKQLGLGALTVAAFVFHVGCSTPCAVGAGAGYAPAEKGPQLAWEARSDWKNVKTDFELKAVGDGVADDTAAIQAALRSMQSRQTLYFPAGTYRITQTLSMPEIKPIQGFAMIGHGCDTVFVWDGEEDGLMLLQENGSVLSTYVGLTFDGAKKAAVGMDISSLAGFETEQLYQHCTFMRFRDSGMRFGKHRKVASAETRYENCLFIDCDGAGVQLYWFNYYDHTFIGCEFTRCGTGMYGGKGVNFYVRECRFTENRHQDLYFAGEHGSSVRRSISVGSEKFIELASSVAQMTIEDCRIEGWKRKEGAIVSPWPNVPLTVMDCHFKNPADPEAAALDIGSKAQPVILSNNRFTGCDKIANEGRGGTVYEIPATALKGAMGDEAETFYQSTVKQPSKVLDVRKDFDAKGDGRTDDTAAIQAALDAVAALGNGAQLYFPAGGYVVTKPLHVRGKDYSISASGFCAGLVWKGDPDGVIMEVHGPQNVRIEHIVIGRHDYAADNRRFDILQHPGENGSSVCYDRVWVWGMYQKDPTRHGLALHNLGPKDSVYVKEVCGNIRIKDSAAAEIFLATTYEGSVCVEGASTERGGFLGGGVRLATLSDPGIWVKDNHSIAFTDFYIESGNQFVFLEGNDTLPPGRVTLSGAKFENYSKAEKDIIQFDGYKGALLIGPYQFYPSGRGNMFTKAGNAPVDIIIWGTSFYNVGLQTTFADNTRLHGLANVFVGADNPQDSRRTPETMKDTPSPETTALIQAAMDDFRRIGAIELKHLRQWQ